MERLICTRCQTAQPADSAPGALCTACGQPVRSERACPWCLTYSPEGKFCRACGCELPEPRLFGAARMLKDAGVDRFSIGARLREMDPELVAVLTRRYEEQRALVLRRVEEVRLCERFLLQDSFSAALDQELTARLPLSEADLGELRRGPIGPFGEAAQLEAIARESPLPQSRTLATLALFRRGRRDRATAVAVLQAAEADSALGVEAALALAHWRHHFGIDRAEGVIDNRLLSARAEQALQDPRTARWGAVARALPLRFHLERPWMNRANAEAQAQLELLTPLLRQGLDDANFDLRFSCALVLGVPDRLQPELAHPDAEVRAAARAACLSLSVDLRRILGELTDLPEEERLRWLRLIPLPAPAPTLELLLAEAERGTPLYCRRLLGLLWQPNHFEYAPDARAALDGWLRRVDPRLLAAEVALEGLEWATTAPGKNHSPDHGCPRQDGHHREWVTAATRAIARLPAAARTDLVHKTGFARWLWLATDAQAQQVLDAWVRDPDPAAGRALLERLSSLESHARDWPDAPLPKGYVLLLGLWDRAGGDALPTLAAHLARGWSYGYHQSTEEMLEAFKTRYRDRQDERALIRLATRQLPARWGLDWHSLHLELVPGTPTCGANPLRDFQALCVAEPENSFHHLEWILDGIEAEPALGVAEALFAHLVAHADRQSTQLLPPAVFFARWLDSAAAGIGDRKLLGALVAALERGWSELLPLVQASADGAESYYTTEKREEVGEILERVKRRCG